jgi:hypothetical protein
MISMRVPDVSPAGSEVPAMPTQWRIICLLLIAALFAALAASARPATAAVRAMPRSQDCVGVVENGSFETDVAWQFDPSPAPPQYVTSVSRSGARSLQIGGASMAAASTARQPIFIPPGATNAILYFWYYPIVEASPGADYFEFSVWSADGSAMLQGPWDLPLGYETWQPAAFDFSAWSGQTFQVAFTVFNDGFGGRTAVFLDDVSLLACSAPPITPTPWPTAMPTVSWTPAPAGDCINVLQNGGFDAGLFGWTPGNNPLPPSVVGDPVLTLPLAAELGSTVRNLNSYSSVRQAVTIPPGYARTFIGFWEYTRAESLTGTDNQQFVLLGPGNVVWATPWKVLENSEAWRQHLYELIGAPSPTFDVYFAAVNDGAGGRTALYVDEVYVWACAAGAMPPAGPAPAMPFSGAASTAEVAPLTPGPTFAAEAPVAEDGAPFAVEALPTPVFVPFSAEPMQGFRLIEEATVTPAGTPLDLTGFPTPEWTEVALPGQPTATAPAGAQSQTTGTPPAGDNGMIGTPEMGMVATPTPAATVTPAITPTATPGNAIERFVAGVQERVAQWPVSWRRVLTALVVFAGLVLVALVAFAVFGRRQRPPRDYYS